MEVIIFQESKKKKKTLSQNEIFTKSRRSTLVETHHSGRFSLGFRPGDWNGHIKNLIHWSFRHFCIELDIYFKAMSWRNGGPILTVHGAKWVCVLFHCVLFYHYSSGCFKLLSYLDYAYKACSYFIAIARIMKANKLSSFYLCIVEPFPCWRTT